MRQNPQPRRREGFRGNGVFGRVLIRLLFLSILGGAAFAVYHYVNGDSYNASMKAAEVFYDKGDYVSALEAYKKISERYPGEIDPLLGAAHAAEQAHETAEAAAAYRRGAEILPAGAPARAKFFYEIGRLYAAQKSWREAQGNFEEAVRLDSTSHDAHAALAEVLEQRGNREAAVEAYQMALILRPSSELARTALERLSALPPEPVAGGDPLSAQQYEHAMQVGTVALDLKLYAEASRYFAEALTVRSDDAEALIKFAESRASLGDTNGAIKYFQRALEQDSDRQDARSRLMELEEERKRRN